MTRRPLLIALAIALLPTVSSAADLMQVYQLARENDPQFSATEAQARATREGAVQARAAMLPQIGGSASYTRSSRSCAKPHAMASRRCGASRANCGPRRWTSWACRARSATASRSPSR